MDKDRQMYQMQQKGMKDISDGVNKITEKPVQIEMIPNKEGDELIHWLRGFVTALKGQPGDTPKKGKDYFTEDEIKEIVKGIESRIKVPKDGETPKKGVDYFTDEEIEEIVSMVMERIELPEDGKDAVVDYKKIEGFLTDKISKLPKPEKISIESIVTNVLEKIPEPEKVNYEVLKDFMRKFLEENQPRRLLNSGGPTTRIGELVDVSASGIEINDLLKWNGSKFIPVALTTIVPPWTNGEQITLDVDNQTFDLATPPTNVVLLWYLHQPQIYGVDFTGTIDGVNTTFQFSSVVTPNSDIYATYQ